MGARTKIKRYISGLMQTELTNILADEPQVIGTIPVEVPSKGLRRWTDRVGLTKPRTAERTLELTLAKMLTFQRITSLVSQLDLDVDSHYDNFARNAPILAVIIATAIHNKPEPVPDELAEAILTNFTNAQLKNAADQVYRGLDYDPFYDTMGLLLNLRPTERPATTV